MTSTDGSGFGATICSPEFRISASADADVGLTDDFLRVDDRSAELAI